MEDAAKKQIVLRCASQKGVIRAADVAALGVSASYLHDLAREGVLDHVGRGLFSHPQFPRTKHHGLVEAAVYAPKSVVCLLSALQFHHIGTQMPHAIWLAIPNAARTPKIPTAPVQIVRMSAAALAAGVEVHMAEGVDLRVFSIPKTIADCFKYRSLVGLDVALEALKDVLRNGRMSPAEVYEYAVIDRVWTVIRPYLEALQ